MIHRVCFGSIERFIGILIEHFAGKFPVWLSPVQIKVIPVSEKYIDYAEKVNKTLFDAGLRTELDSRDEKVGYKIREARSLRIPYMIVVGENELQNGTVTVRRRGSEVQDTLSTDAFIDEIKAKIASKEND